MSNAPKRNPTRAIGLAWAPVDPRSRQLAARFATPDEAPPRQRFDATIEISNLPAGEVAYATIAAVDVGILNLTSFKAPAPEDWYFGQRRLGIELRDVYGRLIDAMQGARGRIRSGGDAAAMRGQSRPPTERLLAFFNGPIRVGADGRATASFDLPDFNGSVRLMAVVWSKNGVGHAAKDVLVRDPVIVSLSGPQFLAPGDRSRVQIDLTHAFGPVGIATVDVTADPELAIGWDGPQRVALGASGRMVLEASVSALSVANPALHVVVTTPGGDRLEKTLIVPIRVNDPETTRQRRVTLKADGSLLALGPDMFGELVPGTGHASFAIGPLALLDVPGLLTALDRYPYGCTEQLASRALPLLYFDEVTEAMGLGQRRDVAERVAVAIGKVLANQSGSGAFGLWRPGAGDLWLDAYITDFLSRAQAAGHAVPQIAFTAALDNLRNQIAYAEDFEQGGEGVAYALMVLAREGMASVGDLRYYANEKAGALATPLAKAQIAAAPSFYGETQRSQMMFRLARAQITRIKGPDHGWRADYGSDLRDAAGVLTLALESGTEALDPDALAQWIAALGGARRSTQEQVWTLLAAHALIKDASAGAILVNQVPIEGTLIRLFDADTLAASGPLVIENRGPRPINAVLTTFGIPTEPQPAKGNGYTIERSYFTMTGTQVAPETIAQNAQLVVRLSIIAQDARQARLMIDDPLPAGFEIDTPNLLRAGDLDALEWLDTDQRIVHAQFRVDRFLPAVDQDHDTQIQLAYIVRAVTPGRYHHPAAVVVDMYRPSLRARTETGIVEILAPAR
jgi:uncharacterized protein YfaS (alpha-2-macroglobulin family)